MSIEDKIKKLEPISSDPTKTEIKQRIAAIVKIKKQLDLMDKRLENEIRLIQSMCGHNDCYSSNWCGRDPGGGGCHTCGKVW